MREPLLRVVSASASPGARAGFEEAPSMVGFRGWSPVLVDLKASEGSVDEIIRL